MFDSDKLLNVLSLLLYKFLNLNKAERNSALISLLTFVMFLLLLSILKNNNMKIVLDVIHK